MLAILSVGAPLIAAIDPLEQDLLLELLPPAWVDGAEPGMLLGTDSLGRDVFSRLVHGSRIALTVAVVAGVLTAMLGTILGLLAGYFGGLADSVISRLVDIWTSFPPVLLAIILVALLGTGLHSVIIAIVVIDWTRFCRVVRAEVMQQRRMDYVDSAVTIGLGRTAILFREILPNILPLVIVLLTLEMGIAVIVEAILSLCRTVAVHRHADLGRDDCRRPTGDPPGLVGDELSVAHGGGDGAGLQFARGRIARCARSDIAPMSDTILTISNLHAELRAGRTAGPGILRDVSLTVHQGEMHGLVGESGAGKSMIAKAILGILPRSIRISEGSIDFLGRQMLGLADSDRRKILGRDISLIPQDPLTALNPARRIGGQMTDVMRLHMGWSRSKAHDAALALLNEVHIRDAEAVLRRYPHELSGGMRQRVLIATAFACEPKLIIADEPTTALDVTVQKQILRLLREMQNRHGTAILLVTHDLGVVAKMCRSLSVIHSGMIVEQGSAADNRDPAGTCFHPGVVCGNAALRTGRPMPCRRCQTRWCASWRQKRQRLIG